jgi:hypothetical protein
MTVYTRAKEKGRKGKLEYIKESRDQEIDSIFDYARDKLAKVDENAKEQKKKIVIDLAKRLEGKIPIETISIEIVNQLRGQVSQRLIHEILPEKYKQKHRVENAKKQKKIQKDENKLAAVAPLKQAEEHQEDEELKNKEVMVTDIDGRTILYYQNKDEDRPSSTAIDTSSLTEGGFSQSSYNAKKNKEQEQPIEKPNQLTVTSTDMGNTEIVADASSSQMSYSNDKDILSFEFSLSRKDVQSYLDSSKSNTDDKVWLNVKVDLKTGKAIFATTGRQYQENVVEKK